MEDEQVPAVVCVHCDSRLFYCKAILEGFSGTRLQSSDFSPVDDDIPQPEEKQEIRCPKCGELFAEVVGSEAKGFGLVLKLEDGSWWPHPPILS